MQCDVRSLARSHMRFFSAYTGYKNADFHNNWCDLLTPANDPLHFSPLLEHSKAIKAYVILAPRKHGKSEVIITYILFMIGNYPDIHILIVSKTATLAENTVRMIRRRIESDPKFRQLFGNLVPKNPQQWTDSSFIVERPTISKFPTLSAAGLEGTGNVTGLGFDLVVCDDIIDIESVTTPLQREKSLGWLREAIIPATFNHGGIIVIGTRWHHDDLYNRLITPVPQGLGWEHQTLCAILDEKKKKTLWPAVWNYEALMKRRSVVGSIIFENQYMNRPTAMEGDVLRAEWLHAWNETDHTFYPPHNLPVYAGIDPSLGENDFFSVSTLAMDRANNRAYLLDVWCEHLSFNEIIDQKLPELFSRYRYQKMYLETNFWQKLLLKYPNMQTHAPSGVAYPIVPIRTVTSKTQRFIPLSSHFESRRVLVNPRLLDKNHNFFKQWVEFPRSEHDDAVDSTEMVVANAFGSDWELPDAQVVGGKFNRD